VGDENLNVGIAQLYICITIKRNAIVAE